MTDIAALLTDSTLRPALIGFAGVGIGALVTVTGQGLGRRAERQHKVNAEVAATIGNSHLMRSNYRAYYAPGIPDVIAEKYLDNLNGIRPAFYKGCNILTVIAPWPIAAAALHLAETHTAFDSYANPISGTGKDTGYENLDLYVWQVLQSENVLTKVTRAPAFWRWPSIVVTRLKKPPSQ